MQNIKNLVLRKIKNNELLPYIIVGGLTVGVVAMGVSYETYETKEQIVSDIITEDDTFYDDNGNICHYFAVGEHKISIYRNDAFSHEIQKIVGYEIESVKLNGWNRSNVTVYVNNEPVIAKVTSVVDGEYLFEEFGVVTEKVKEYSK